MNIADMAIETFNAESVLLRVMMLVDQRGESNCKLYIDIAHTYLYDAADRINKSGKDAVNSFAEGDDLTMILLLRDLEDSLCAPHRGQDMSLRRT